MWGKINLAKEQEMTSQQAVNGLRRILSIKKIGHSGTLDPMAEGVLNCYVGQGTKFIDLLAQDKKVYEAGFLLGKVSDTQDIWGNVKEIAFTSPGREEVEKALNSFLGTTQQLPPMYSALKVKGKPLYRYAREGKEIQRKKREIHISKLNLLSYDGNGGSILVHCSRGTYVRSLLYDLGEVLGTGAVMSSLLRLRNDWADLDRCYSLQEIEELYGKGDRTFLRPLDEDVELPKINLDPMLYKDLRLGRKKTICQGTGEGRVLLYCQGQFVGTALWVDHELQREKILQVDL